MTVDALNRDPELPPLYAAAALPADRDPLVEAARQAEAGASAGTFLWSRRSDCIDLAVVLEPDNPRERSLPVCLVAMVALVDAIGGVIPPSVAVTFGWPDRIDVNGALAGGLRLAMAPCDAAEDVPAWMVVAITIAVTGDLGDDSPGLKAGRTTLYDEGCGFIDIVDFMERFGRHFMYWVNRWLEDGFDPVRRAWLARESGFGGETGIYYEGRRVAGRVISLDGDGGAMIETANAMQIFPLDAALHPGSWSRDDLLLARHVLP